jgi:hypothetical protein
MIGDCPFCKIFRDANREMISFLDFLSEKNYYQKLLQEYKEWLNAPKISPTKGISKESGKAKEVLAYSGDGVRGKATSKEVPTPKCASLALPTLKEKKGEANKNDRQNR